MEWIARSRWIPVSGRDILRSRGMVANGCERMMGCAQSWIFRQIAQYTATGSYDRPTVEDRYRMIHAYFQCCLPRRKPPRICLVDARMGETAGKMKQFATWFTHGVPGGASCGPPSTTRTRERSAGPGGAVFASPFPDGSASVWILAWPPGWTAAPNPKTKRALLLKLRYRKTESNPQVSESRSSRFLPAESVVYAWHIVEFILPEGSILHNVAPKNCEAS